MTAGIKANADGSAAIQVGGSDAITITSGLNTTFAGTVTSASTVAGATGVLYPLVNGTAVSASGTAINYTSIPSWVKRITVMFYGLSTNGGSLPLVQLGSGSIQTSGYLGRTNDISTNTAAYSTGFNLSSDGAAANTYFGAVTLTFSHATYWLINGILSRTDGNNQYRIAGGVILSGGALDQLRITTVNGTDQYDAGTINILYE